MNWNYDPSQYSEKSFEALKPGDYRIRIQMIEETTSAKGNDMLKLTFEVSGMNSKLFHHLVFMPDNPSLTNQKLGEFFNAFGLPANALQNMNAWIGKVGACRVKNEVYNGENQAKINYFLAPDKASKLPAWQEPSGNNNQQASAPQGYTPVTSFTDIPF